jgi:hypothetical protein
MWFPMIVIRFLVQVHRLHLGAGIERNTTERALSQASGFVCGIWRRGSDYPSRRFSGEPFFRSWESSSPSQPPHAFNRVGLRLLVAYACWPVHLKAMASNESQRRQNAKT